MNKRLSIKVFVFSFVLLTGFLSWKYIHYQSDKFILVDKNLISHNDGFAYAVDLSMLLGYPGDTLSNPFHSRLRFYEDGVLLGYPHAMHDSIRQYGGGRYSDWIDDNDNRTLVFSCADSSDPRTNNKTYAFGFSNLFLSSGERLGIGLFLVLLILSGWISFGPKREESESKNDILAKFSISFGVIGCGIGFLHLIQRLYFELTGAMNPWDNPMYWAVGRGILNGLMPYTDLFENKPPGIFLLSALSLRLTGDVALCRVFQVAALLVFFIFGCILFERISRTYPKHWQWHVRVSSWALVIFLTLFVAHHAGKFQNESFGAAFMMIAIYLICHFTIFNKEKRERPFFLDPKIYSVVFFIILAALFKEPFLIVGILVIMVLVPQKLLKYLGSIILVMTIGFIVSTHFTFVNDYLRSLMSTGYTRTFTKIANYHVQRPLIYDTYFLDGTFFGEFHKTMDMFHQFMKPSGLWLIGILVLSFFMIFIRKKTMLSRCLWVAGIFMSWLWVFEIIFAANRLSHHYVFFIPILLCTLVWLALWLKGSGKIVCGVYTIFFPISLFYLFCVYNPPDYQGLTLKNQYQEHLARTFANRMDQILDKEEEDRYLYIGLHDHNPYGYTKHSPLGPLFVQQPGRLRLTSSIWTKTFLDNLWDGPQYLILDNLEGISSGLRPLVKKILKGKFVLDVFNNKHLEDEKYPWRIYRRIESLN